MALFYEQMTKNIVISHENLVIEVIFLTRIFLHDRSLRHHSLPLLMNQSDCTWHIFLFADNRAQ